MEEKERRDVEEKKANNAANGITRGNKRAEGPMQAEDYKAVGK